MGEITKIQWCDHTFNPWRGCVKVAAGCANCYAEKQSKRNPNVLGVWGADGTRVVASEQMWGEPKKWNKTAVLECGNCGNESQTMPTPWESPIKAPWDFECGNCGSSKFFARKPRVFCASLCDIFEEWPHQLQDSRGNCAVHRREWGRESGFTSVSLKGGNDALTLDGVRRRLFRLIDDTPNLDYLLLTKRPENITTMWPVAGNGKGPGSVDYLRRDNVWLGTSIACQEDADRNIPLLLKCRDLAPVLFLSIEPLIGPVDLSKSFQYCDESHGHVGHPFVPDANGCNSGGIDWVIVGGESGPKARPCRPEWIRSIVKQCRDAETKCFVKQLGANVVTRNDMVEDAFNGRDGWPDPEVEHDIHGYRENYQGADCRIRLRDPKGGDPEEWPEDLRVREFPSEEVVT